MTNERFSTTPEELFSLLGEQMFIRHRVEQQNKVLLEQAGEMSNALLEARAEAKQMGEKVRCYEEAAKFIREDHLKERTTRHVFEQDMCKQAQAPKEG